VPGRRLSMPRCTTNRREEQERLNSSASGNHSNANGTATVGFDVWYDLPYQGREALVTVSLSVKDDDGYTTTDSVQVKTAQ
jgi:hypothetical protein